MPQTYRLLDRQAAVYGPDVDERTYDAIEARLDAELRKALLAVADEFPSLTVYVDGRPVRGCYLCRPADPRAHDEPCARCKGSWAEHVDTAVAVTR